MGCPGTATAHRCALHRARETRRGPTSPPTAVQPQPLIGIFADPTLDDRGDRLHRRVDVDPATGVARRLDRFRDFAPEAAARQADGAHAVDRTVEMAGEPG